MQPRITLITLGVDDLERAVAFYRDGLGLKTDGIVGTEFEHGAVAFFDLTAARSCSEGCTRGPHHPGQLRAQRQSHRIDRGGVHAGLTGHRGVDQVGGRAGRSPHDIGSELVGAA